MATAIKHPVPDRFKPSFVTFDIRALWRSVLRVRVPECQKSNDILAKSGTGCFIAVPIWQQWVSKGQRINLFVKYHFIPFTCMVWRKIVILSIHACSSSNSALRTTCHITNLWMFCQKMNYVIACWFSDVEHLFLAARGCLWSWVGDKRCVVDI